MLVPLCHHSQHFPLRRRSNPEELSVLTYVCLSLRRGAAKFPILVEHSTSWTGSSTYRYIVGDSQQRLQALTLWTQRTTKNTVQEAVWKQLRNSEPSSFISFLDHGSDRSRITMITVIAFSGSLTPIRFLFRRYRIMPSQRPEKQPTFPNKGKILTKTVKRSWQKQSKMRISRQIPVNNARNSIFPKKWKKCGKNASISCLGLILAPSDLEITGFLFFTDSIPRTQSVKTLCYDPEFVKTTPHSY